MIRSTQAADRRTDQRVLPVRGEILASRYDPAITIRLWSVGQVRMVP